MDFNRGPSQGLQNKELADKFIASHHEPDDGPQSKYISTARR